MKEIKALVEYIHEELHDAEKYAKAAAKHKDNDKELSSTYAELAHQELNHMDKLHSQAVRLIKAYRDKGNEPPAAMLAVWDWEHEKMIEHTAHVKHLLENAR